MNRQNTIVNQEDMIGQKFNRLLVVSAAPSRHKRAYWNCLCDCGKTCVAMGKYLRQGKKQSCGCLSIENRQGVSKLGVLARQANMLPPGEAAFNVLFATYRSSAEIRGLIFELTKDQVRVLTKQNCFYCGKAPTSVYRPNISNGYLYNGIDRRNNLLGYVLGNVVSCCKLCNWMKNAFEETTFLSHCASVANYQQRKECVGK
jgi:hypothetical protein